MSFSDPFRSTATCVPSGRFQESFNDVSRIAFINGQYVPHGSASVHIDDRAHNFADGVYEVILVASGRLIDTAGHLARLRRSLHALDMEAPVSDRALLNIVQQTIRRNRITDGIVYFQINRGSAPRNHVYDNAVLEPTIVCTARSVSLPMNANNVDGVKVITRPDNRWKHVDIKTVSLLPNAMARTAAARAGAYEAWFVDDTDHVTECSASNAWIVDSNGVLVTRQPGNILSGITRERVITIARELGYDVIERPFSVEEAISAREAFLTSTTSFVKPVVQIDDSIVGNGHPGSTTCRLLEAYLKFVRS